MQEKCQFCGGVVNKKTVSLDLWKKEKLYVFKNVPAKVCEQCGEKYFSSKIHGKLTSSLKEKSKPDEINYNSCYSLKKFAD